MAYLPDLTWLPSWWASVADLAGTLQKNSDPLTLVLGAGVSRTSGAPSTAEVEAALTAAVTRIPPGDLRKRLHEIAGADKRRALVPIFEQLDPYIGYHCLAALARTRRVVVINLNWEPLVTMACDKLGVPWVTYDLDDRAHWTDSALLPANRGLVDVHLHGRISGNPRFGFAETTGFASDELDHLRSVHAGARRIYLGVSLDDDHDVVDLLRKLDDGDIGMVWSFFRGPDITNATELSRLVAKLGARGPVFCQGEDVDFDHILLALLDGAHGRRWNRLRSENPQVRLPALEHLVLPKPEVLRPALGAEVTVLVGDPQLGKTTAAWLLAGLRQAWSDSPGAVRAFDGAVQAKASLAIAPGAVPADCFIIENPFGEAPDPNPNPGFGDDLARWAASAGVAGAVVTLRTADWQAAAPGSDPPGVFVASPVPGDWYRIDDLRRFAKRCSPSGLHLADEVAPEGLDTPGRVLDRAGGIAVASVGSGPSRIEAVESERQRLLKEHPALGAFCCLLRLQEFAGEPIEVDVLRSLSKLHGNSPAANLMLYRYKMDDRSQIRLSLPVDTAATDRWMIDRPAEVAALLDDPACPVSLRDAWRTWKLMSQVRRGDWLSVRSFGPEVLADHAGDILAADPLSVSMS